MIEKIAEKPARKVLRLRHTHRSQKHMLIGGVAALAIGSTVVSAQEAAPGNARTGITQNWALSIQATRSDNFRRLTDITFRQDRFGTGPEDVDLVPVAIDAPGNTIVSGGINGATLFQRPSLNGLLSGSLQVGGFLNTDDLDTRLSETATPQPAPGTISSTFGLREVEEVFVQPNIVGAVSAQVVDNLFYVDVSALAQEQALGFGTLLAQSGVGRNGNEIIYAGGSVSPYLLRQFANDSTVELRVRTTALAVVDENLDGINLGGVDPDSIQFTNDSYSYEGIAEYTSGTLADRLKFVVGASARQVKEDGSVLQPEVDFTQASVSVDAEYGVTGKITLLGGIGYDEIAFDDVATSVAGSDEDDLGGVYWEAGLRYVPSRRGNAEIRVGERYDGTSVNATVEYQPASRISIRGLAERQLDTGAQDLAGLVVGGQSRALASLTALSQTQGSTSSALIDRVLAFEGAGYRDVQLGRFGIAAFNRYGVEAAGNYERTNLSASYFYTDSTFEGGENTQQELSFRAARQLSRTLSAAAEVRYLVNDGNNGAGAFVDGFAGADGEATEQFYRISGAYALGNQLALTASYYFATSNREATDGTEFEFDENAVTVGLRWEP